MKRVKPGRCRCGAHLKPPPDAYILEAVYVTDPGTRHEKRWCCEWCALGQGCLCSVWTTPITTERLDTLLLKLDGRPA